MFIGCLKVTLSSIEAAANNRLRNVMTGLFGNDRFALTIVEGDRPGVALPRLFVLWMKC